MQILPNGKCQFIDQNGAPLVNGSVYFYAPGTNNPLPTYQDSGGTIQNSNPIALDSRGQAIIWGSATYRQVVYDANNVLVWDQIVSAAASAAALAGTGGSALIGLADGSTLASAFLSSLDRVVDSIAALRAISHSVFTRAHVTGYYAPHDGGGGLYQYDANDTSSADNGGTIIVASDNARWKLQLTGPFSVKQFGAKGDGTTDDSGAFTRAFTAGGQGATIRVPMATYYLSVNPMGSSNVNATSVRWSFDLGATFTGPGTTSNGSFPRLATNPWVTAAGEWELMYDTVAAAAGGATMARVLEQIIPSTGKQLACVSYMGGYTNGNITADSSQCILNLVQNITDADLMPNVYGPGSCIYKSLEIDVNIDVSASGAHASPGIIGMLLTGGGSGGAYQGNATYGIIFQRGTGAWENAIDISASIYGINVTAQNTGIFMRTQWTPTSGDGTVAGKMGRGIAFDNAPTIYGPLFIGAQMSNGNDTIWLARNTDSSPSGAFFRARDAANANDLCLIGINGEITTYAPASSNGSANNAGGIACNGLTLRGTTNLQLGQTFVSGAPSAAGYITVYDSAGRQCKLLCA